ncbi:hypothetical protein [Geopsychrobacter electrodiphilus]|uniref:Ppx/GppA phosphatase family protein n=1 Tax=Geopsychrobacter electrodiphilus TaxID=225196 RepID=UPI00037C6E9E|nr:hypothetical protein [Geopsychrobacter electrodiphilus]
MIRAAIDIGSNTVRMLIPGSGPIGVSHENYFRRVTRLAGDYDPVAGLASASMERTLIALRQFAAELTGFKVDEICAVGTAILRNAVNSKEFLEKVHNEIGIDIRVIDGKTEAELSCRGILTVLSPTPKRAVLFDIGGGSTEIIMYENGKILQRESLPLGVVQLAEGHESSGDCLLAVQAGLKKLIDSSIWKSWKRDTCPPELIGTAGTVTTLAALKLEMHHYDGTKVNNLVLSRDWLNSLYSMLRALSPEKRRELPGMEEGRADLIIPGLQIVLELLDCAGGNSLRAADAGLLEGLLLD